MVERSPFRQRRPPCKTNKEMSDEAADAAALTLPYLSFVLEFLPGLARMFLLWRSTAKMTQSNTLPTTVTSGIAKTSVRIDLIHLSRLAAHTGFQQLTAWGVWWACRPHPPCNTTETKIWATDPSAISFVPEASTESRANGQSQPQFCLPVAKGFFRGGACPCLLSIPQADHRWMAHSAHSNTCTVSLGDSVHRQVVSHPST